ncbi:unnamed protein product [Heligmosomoides polygyrus]|uniref:TCF3 fusion partner n=1 Tax=Heligmosomoides polygyrus TaxID=6339 RepID=A0A183G384_HELPZ|nr:unnamed protein product [Heligmosomoides polygyrus]
MNYEVRSEEERSKEEKKEEAPFSYPEDLVLSDESGDEERGGVEQPGNVNRCEKGKKPALGELNDDG